MTKIRSTSSSRIQDRRGQGGGGGGFGFPGLGGGGGGGLGIPMKAGGGIIGLIVLAAAILLPQLLGGNQQSLTSNGVNPDPGTDTGVTECVTEIEQVVCGGVDDVSDYWIAEWPQVFDGQYREAFTRWFSDVTNTACGQASAQIGPFYCPADEVVYFDLPFLVQLQDQFGATGDLAAQYIVAHEYGHHVQNILGISSQVSQLQQQHPDQANAYSVALELQADCFAGAWAKNAEQRGQLDPGEISEALNAAAAVGDDRIQQQAGQQINPDQFTHGTSEQRVSWFRRGFDTGDPRQCNTFDEMQ
ncbi:MAG: neutral zinc metallopeptidase [Ilumatobacteraceae bacterium]